MTGAATAAAGESGASRGPDFHSSDLRGPDLRGPDPDLLSIGEVLALLREDFPDVTISKLRFLEAEGLVEPQRTAAGYRKYSAGDVDRLAFVLSAQRDRYLPLRVIRDHLAAWERGEAVMPPDYGLDLEVAALPRPAVETPAVPMPRPEDAERERPLRRDAGRLPRPELLERSGLADADLRELESAGLIATRTPGWYDEDAVIIAAAAAGLARHGIEVRHLRAFRGTADRQVGLFAAVVTPLQRSASPAERARVTEVIDELTALSAQLHAALVRSGMRAALGR